MKLPGDQVNWISQSVNTPHLEAPTGAQHDSLYVPCTDSQRAVLNNLRAHFLNFSEMIAIKFFTEIHGAQRINPFDSGEFLA